MSWPKNNYKTYDTNGNMGNEDQWRDAFNRRFDRGNAGQRQQRHAAPPDYLQPLRDAKTGPELKKAYYKLLQQYHPDKAGDTPDNNNKTKAINSLYSKLKKPC